MSENIFAAISDAFYGARNAGRTMTDAANDATAAVERIFAQRESEIRADALMRMADLFREAGPKAWGGMWLTTGENVADLVASWCEQEADEIAAEAAVTP